MGVDVESTSAWPSVERRPRPLAPSDDAGLGRQHVRTPLVADTVGPEEVSLHPAGAADNGKGRGRCRGAEGTVRHNGRR